MARCSESTLYVECDVPQLPELVLNASGRYVGTEVTEADNSNLIGAHHTFNIGAAAPRHWIATP